MERRPATGTLSRQAPGQHRPGDGILTQIGSSRRNHTWAAQDVLEALDAFTERARRER